MKHSSRDYRLLVGISLAIAVAAYALSFDVAWPRFFPDEMCHLGWARVLSNIGGFYRMGLASYCEPGYAALIAPLHWVFDGPESFYRAAIALNAVLVATCFVLARHVGAMNLGLSSAQAWAAGALAASYPGVLAYAGYALPETVLYVLTLAWLLAWTKWIDRQSVRSLGWLVLSTSVLFIAHSRMLVFVLALSAGAFGFAVLSRDPQRKRQALYVLAAMAMTVYASHAAKGFALARGWDADPLIALDRIAASATIATISSMLSKAAGQFLFALFATAGLALIPLAWITGHLTPHRLHTLFTRPTRMELKAIASPVLLLLLAIETAIFLNSSERFDLSFYGRYAGPLIVPCMLIGLSLLNQGNLRRISIGFAALIALCLLLFALSPAKVPYADYSRGHVAGALVIIDWFASSQSNPELWQRVALVTLAGSGLAIALIFRPWWCLVGAALATSAASFFAGPFHRAPPMSEYVPTPVTIALSKDPCTIYWSDAINGRLQFHQSYRLQYLYPACQMKHFISSTCDLPSRGVLVVPVGSACPGPELASIPLPPELTIISLEQQAGERK